MIDDGKGGELHLEGRALLHGYMSWLNGKGLNKASQVVVSGGSAGGHAVFQTLSPFQGNSPRAFTVGMPVSGFFATVCTSVALCAVEANEQQHRRKGRELVQHKKPEGMSTKPWAYQNSLLPPSNERLLLLVDVGSG